MYGDCIIDLIMCKIIFSNNHNYIPSSNLLF